MTDNITIPRATVKQALDALERALETSMRQALKARIPECGEFSGIAQDVDWAATALTAALEQQQAEPVAWMFEDDEDNGHKTFRQTPPSPEAVAYLVKWNRPAWVPLYTAAPQRKPLTDEQDRALCEAYCNDASDKYFKARPALDFPEMRRIFYAGHRKAWISYEAAHGIKGEV